METSTLLPHGSKPDCYVGDPHKIGQNLSIETPLSTVSEWSAPVGELKRHLSLVDLIVIGVGGTIGSGIFVLCGLIARDYAGPATFLSWGVAGLAACLSGFCCAELAGKIPEAGSAYAYASVTIGEFAAFVAAACLSLNYVASASAVARSWGDKVVHWMQAEMDSDHWLLRVSNPGFGVNTMAFVVSSMSVLLLLWGVQESKFVANLFTALKVALIIFMIITGIILTEPSNLMPLVPHEFGVKGVFRGATSCFFGYIGFDEACCLAGEAVDPHRNLPRAVLGTIFIVTLLYMLAALVLTGMQPYTDISSESGFPDAFRANHVDWAVQITSAGEIITLPIVVLISLLAQPRLQWAVAKDGLIPPFFAVIDENGNLWNGILFSGSLMVAIATFVPFTFLDDVISTGILLAFCISNWSVVSLRYQTSTDGDHSHELDKLMLVFNILSMMSGLLARHCMHIKIGVMLFAFVSLSLVCVLRAILMLLKSTTFSIEEDGYYHAPLVPFLPCLGIYVNWYLVAQLEITGILLLLLYIALVSIFYFTYGVKHSLGRRQRKGWKPCVAIS